MVVRNTRHVSRWGAVSHIALELPTCTDPMYWVRHQLSMDDIRNIVEHVPTQYLWLMIVSYGGTCTWTGVRISHAHAFDTVVSCRSLAVNALLEIVGYTPSTIHKCDNMDTTQGAYHTTHTPPLPRHSIPNKDFDHARRNLVVCQHTPSHGTDNVSDMFIPNVVSYIGHDWVVTSIEGDHICATRVVYEESDTVNVFSWCVDTQDNVWMGCVTGQGLKDTEENVYKGLSSYISNTRGLAHRKTMGQFSNGRRAVFTDECVLFTPLHV
jgi:hypothetical protein